MDFSDAKAILGELIDSPVTNTLLAKYPQLKVRRPSDGAQYVISKQLGISFLFLPDTGYQGGRTKKLRKCQSIFLYANDVEGYQQFDGEIPLGFKFSDTRQELISKQKPFRTWKIGEGEVPVDEPCPSHDKWKTDSLVVSAHYHQVNGSIAYFIISRNKGNDFKNGSSSSFHY